MRNLLLIPLLAASLSIGAAQSAFQPDAQYTNDLRNFRAQLQAQQPKRATNELDQLAATLARSNRLAQIIPELLFSSPPDLTNAAALLQAFPGKVDDLQRYGQPLLYTAVNENKSELFNFLLENKANPEATTYNDTPLIQAIQYRRWDMAYRLIQAGASVTRTNLFGRAAAATFFENWYPSSSGSQPPADLMPLMLQRGLDPFVASRRDSTTSILEECLSRESGYRGTSGAGSVFFSELLLTNNASPARRTPLGDTSLHLATYWEQTNAINLLLAAGFPVDQTNSAGLTPLQALAGSGWLRFAPNLAAPRRTAATATNAPVPARNLTISEWLLDRGATLDVFTAAALNRTNELAAILATNAALARTRDSFGRTPLHYAVINGGSFPGSIYYGGIGTPIILNSSIRFSSQPGFPQGFMAGGAPTPTNVPIASITLLLNAGADPSAATTKTVPPIRHSQPLPVGTTPLHLAARDGNTVFIRALLAARASVQTADADGNTPLHFAARTWQTNAVTLLLNAKAPLEVTNLASQTPLRAAVESSASAAASVLLKAGASVTNGLGTNTLLHLAAARNDVNTLTLLLKHKLPLELRDASGRTPYHAALLGHAWNSIVFLRDEGANLNAANYDGDTALHLLAAQQDESVYHAPEESSLVQWQRKQLATGSWAGRGLNLLIKSKVMSPIPPPGWTNTSLTAWAIEHGAKVNATNRAGQTPLHVLCAAHWARWYQGHQSSNRVVALLKAGASLDLPDANGFTPLHIAATNASAAMFKLILAKAGTNALNRPDVTGRTLLHRAVENSRENFENVSALLGAGANPNAADKDGRTPLHLALQFRNDGYVWQRQNLVVALITNGANPNLTDRAGRTPLNDAIEFRTYDGSSWYRQQVISTLLTHKADPNIADRDGNTPLHRLFSAYATNYQLTSMRTPMTDLVKHGANPALTNRAGQTPLHLIAPPPQAYSHTLDFVKAAGISETNRAFGIRDAKGDTPLHVWARTLPNCSSCADFFSRILAVGDNAHLTNAAGETPLSLSLAANNRFLITRAALSATVLPEMLAKPDASGQPLLHRMLTNLNLGYGDNQQWLRRVLATNRALVNLTNAAGDTPLHIALQKRDSWMPRILMEAGADPMIKNLRGETPIRLAAIQFPNGPPSPAPPGTRMPFFVALRSRNEAEINRWLEADPGLATITNRDGITPVMAASDARNFALVDRLIALGAPLDALTALRLGRIEDFRTLLPQVPRPVPAAWPFEAVRFGQLEALQQLAAAGCDLKTPDGDGLSLLFRARAAEQTAITDWLTTQGCPPTFFDAIASGELAQVESFLKAGNSLVNQANDRGRAPLICAVAAGQSEIVALLLKRGAVVDVEASERWNALHLAAASDASDIARLLLKAGIATNALASGSLSALHIAAAYGATNMAELLIQNGAVVNAQSEGGFKNTPLHWAVHMGQVEMVKLLLAHGADLKLKNNRNGGETPLDLARLPGNSTGMGFGVPPEVRQGYPRRNLPDEQREAILRLLEAE